MNATHPHLVAGSTFSNGTRSWTLRETPRLTELSMFAAGYGNTFEAQADFHSVVYGSAVALVRFARSQRAA